MDTKEKRDATVKKMGDMLLEGWKMLAVACPICYTALLQKNEQMWCPGCDVRVVGEAEVADVIPQADRSTQESYSDEEDAESDSEVEYDFVQSFNEAKREQDRKKSASTSSKMGELLLKGWTMLAEECNLPGCPGVPLMQKKGGPKYCVSCDKNLAQDTVPVCSEEIQLFNMEDAPVLPPLENTPDASALIGQKLLAGWALLDEVCMGACRGATPLMRDKKQQKYCVLCGYLPKPETNTSTTATASKATPSSLSRSSVPVSSIPIPPSTSSSAPLPKQEEKRMRVDDVNVSHVSLQMVDEKLLEVSLQLAATDAPADICNYSQAIKALAEAKFALQRTI